MDARCERHKAIFVISIWRMMLGLWLVSVLLVISLPWSKYDGVPHWKNLKLVPFEDYDIHPSGLTEAALNIVAFIPIGYLAIRSFCPSDHRRIFLAFLLGAVSSFGIESYQLLCHDRVPSITDVLMNVGGTGIGVCLAFAIDHMVTSVGTHARRFTV